MDSGCGIASEEQALVFKDIQEFDRMELHGGGLESIFIVRVEGLLTTFIIQVVQDLVCGSRNK